MTAEFRDSDPVLRGNFESELRRATAMISEGNARYWLAYCRGLRRRFGGPEKVSEGEHQRWLRLHPALHSDELAGYGDALRLVTRAGPETVEVGCTCEALRMTV